MPRLVLDSATDDDPTWFALGLSVEAAGLVKAIERWAERDGWLPDDAEVGFTLDDLNEIDEEGGSPEIRMKRLLRVVALMCETAALLRRLEPVQHVAKAA